MPNTTPDVTMPAMPAMPAMPVISPDIVLCTLNAKFIHASLGLRYLLANMGELRPQTALREFTINRPIAEIVAQILETLGEPSDARKIVGFGVYIWNVMQTTEVVRQIKAARPGICVVLGGPEVSHESSQQDITQLADYVISGWGDLSFARLCRAVRSGPKPLNKLIVGEQPPLSHIAWPYPEYTDSDLAHRLLYVEASRGCPFKCEFCLSALDQTAWAFDTDGFLEQMDALYRRGARHFKFVDRTFNLKIDVSIRILAFFLERLQTPDGRALFVHFEVIPDHLPDRLKAVIAQFPPGVLQLELGVQSFNPEVQQRISRRQDNDRTADNLCWLVSKSNAHIHADLIFGLPGETLDSFATGFDRLYALRPHEIQLGLLKRLRGTPITRHSAGFGMFFDEHPPYTVQRTSAVDEATMQRFTRFARYWDCIANSGRFKRTLGSLLNPVAEKTNVHSAFGAFLGFSDWLWADCAQTNQLSPEFLVDALFTYMSQVLGQPEQTVRANLLADYSDSGARGSPQILKGYLAKCDVPPKPTRQTAKRQQRHLTVRQTPD